MYRTLEENAHQHKREREIKPSALCEERHHLCA